MFDLIIHTALRQRLMVLGLACLLLVAGGLAAKRTPVDVFPDLNKPMVTLLTEAGGMAPEEVEQSITFPIEAAMNGMPGVTRVRSVSGIGLSVVYVEFDWGSEIYRNRQQVTERLALIRDQMPPGIVPQLGPLSSIMGEILLLAIPADPARIDPMQVREYADWVVRPRLLTVPGVAQVIPIGGGVRQYRVTPLPGRLNAAGLTVDDIRQALQNFSHNAAGGFVERDGREYLVRSLGQTQKLEDLERLPVITRNGVSMPLRQVAEVGFAPAVKRGDASYGAAPAVILSVQKQPGTDTLALTRAIESRVAELEQRRPAGIAAPHFLFRQADFIAHAIGNVQEALRDGALMVAVILWLFLGNARTTLISLSAIPLSLLMTALVFHLAGLSINTMTLGGLAIAIGELVDDAVVDVENVLRRLRENRQSAQPRPVLGVILGASREVRSGVVYATLIVILVFIPLFALPGIEGRLFTPLGIAYIVSILSSLLVAMTVTPVLCYYLLPGLPLHSHTDSRLVAWLKAQDARLLDWSHRRQQTLLAAAAATILLAAASLPFLPRAFLPAFNEGTLTVSMLLNPGTSLSESNRLGSLAESLLLGVPEVSQVGRRTGRAEMDEHAEGVHSSEIDVDLGNPGRDRQTVVADIRQRLAALPANISVGQPISHRLDHLLSGVRARIALKIYGDDLDTLRSQAEQFRQRLAGIPGLTDLQIEKQVLIPQYKIRIDHEAVARHGLPAGQLVSQLERLLQGENLSHVVEGNRRFDLVIRLPDSARQGEGLADLLIATPSGTVPLSRLARIEEDLGPNQIGRENTRRRIVISANTDGSDMGRIIAAIRSEIAAHAWPEGCFTSLEGQFQAQEEAARLIGLLALLGLGLIFLVLYTRYRSAVLAGIVMGNIPLALVGAITALWLTGQPLSIAALVGFVTLTGIAARNGILKISHYINLCAFEGERFGWPMIVRGSLERLTPVLMTALVAAFALVPLLLSGDASGKEILHPVAVVIFGGLLSSTLLDTVLTPLMFWRWGEAPLARLLADRPADAY